MPRLIKRKYREGLFLVSSRIVIKKFIQAIGE